MGAGKVAGLARIDDRDRQVRALQGQDEGCLVATRRFQHHQNRRYFVQPLHQRTDCFGLVAHALDMLRQRDIEIPLADIDTDKNRCLHPDLLFLAVRAFCPCNRSRPIEKAEEHAERRAFCPRMTRSLRPRRSALQADGAADNTPPPRHKDEETVIRASSDG